MVAILLGLNVLMIYPCLYFNGNVPLLDMGELWVLSWPSQRKKWNIRLERPEQTRMQ